jgi:hypothetical protein
MAVQVEARPLIPSKREIGIGFDAGITLWPVPAAVDTP